MLRILLLALTAMGLAACSHDDGGNKGSKPQAPSRVSEHKPTECPVGIEGVYTLPGAKASITIRKYGGNLEVSLSTGDSIIVDGRPTAVKDGSSTAICTGGSIEFRTVNSDGTLEVESLEKATGGINFHSRDKQGNPQEHFIPRTGDAAPIGEVAPAGDQPKSPAQGAVTCSTGFAYTYQYSVNDCKTGSHTLCSLIEACAALANDEFNNGCAHDDRMKQFGKMCN